MVDTSITRYEGDEDVRVCAELSPSSLTIERPVLITLTTSQSVVPSGEDCWLRGLI